MELIITKIIDGLYFTIGMMLFNPLTGESKKPDELNKDDRTTYDACMGAIELLKMQKPRVIAFEEIDNYEVLWLEVRDVNTEEGLAPWVKTKSGHWFSPLLCSKLQPDMMLSTSEEYGKICRCWTARPTEKQRKAAKWE